MAFAALVPVVWIAAVLLLLGNSLLRNSGFVMPVGDDLVPPVFVIRLGPESLILYVVPNLNSHARSVHAFDGKGGPRRQVVFDRHCCARSCSTHVLFGNWEPADGSSDHNGNSATMNSEPNNPPYVDIEFPVLWRFGEVLNVDGAELAREMTPARRQQIFRCDLDGGYIFFDPAEFWTSMPPGPIHAIMRGWEYYDDMPTPRLWFVAGIYMDHANRPYQLWWACDHVATYVTYWG